eukprot:scaffold14958_cov79-Phaeocystis_antarctica.AAC.6
MLLSFRPFEPAGGALPRLLRPLLRPSLLGVDRAPARATAAARPREAHRLADGAALRLRLPRRLHLPAPRPQQHALRLRLLRRARRRARRALLLSAARDAWPLFRQRLGRGGTQGGHAALE